MKKKEENENEKKKKNDDVSTSGYNSIFSRLTLLQEQYATNPIASRFPSVHLTLSTKPTQRFVFPHYLAEG
jgi:hypothetical protein